MYVVVSKWRLSPGVDPIEGPGKIMRAWLRRQDGVNHVHTIQTNDGGILAIAAYRDEATHRRLIDGDDSPFERKAKELGMGSFGEWLWSERGETLD